MTLGRLEEPLACQTVRTLAPQLATLDAERRGRVRGHLARCHACAAAVPPQPRPTADRRPAAVRAAAHGVVSTYLLTLHGGFGMLWDAVQALAAQGEPGAQAQLAEGARWLTGALAFWQQWLSPVAGASLSVAPQAALEAPTLTAEVLDATGRPQARQVSWTVRPGAGPRLTADGRFTCTFHSAETLWHGAPMLVTLRLVEHRRLSFTSVVEPDPAAAGGIVHFAATGLPQGAEVAVPLECLQASLIASPSEVVYTW